GSGRVRPIPRRSASQPGRGRRAPSVLAGDDRRGEVRVQENALVVAQESLESAADGETAVVGSLPEEPSDRSRLPHERSLRALLGLQESRLVGALSEAVALVGKSQSARTVQ